MQISTVFKEAVQARKAPIDLMLHTNLLVQNNFCNIGFGFHCLHLYCVLFWRSK